MTKPAICANTVVYGATDKGVQESSTAGEFLAPWLLRAACRFFLAAIRKDDVDHVQHNRHVSDQQAATEQGHAAKQFTDFERQKQSAGDRRYPFGPSAASPKAVRLSETKYGVRKCEPCGSPEFGIRYVVGEVEKDLRDAAVGADVKHGENAFRVKPGIFVHQQESTDSHQRHENAFDKFDGGYRLEHAPLAARWFWRGMAHAHETYLRRLSRVLASTILSIPVQAAFSALRPTPGRRDFDQHRCVRRLQAT